VHSQFDRIWPFAADHLGKLWSNQTQTEFIRLTSGDGRSLAEVVTQPERAHCLACLGASFTIDDLKHFTSLQDATFYSNGYSPLSDWDVAINDYLKTADIRLIEHTSEGFWSESVAEFGLTLSALCRIPQNYHAIMTDLSPWKQYHQSMNQGPGTRGQQFSDDTRFTHGTVAWKRGRIVGGGNIGSSYASFCKMMGAYVATWDPFAPHHHAFYGSTSHKDTSLREIQTFL
jgi:hypothetical protein